MNQNPQRISFIVWSALAACIIFADQISKFWIVQNYELGEWTKITDFFNIVRAHNTGAAFSFLAQAGGWQQWFFVGIAFVAVIFIIWQIAKHPAERLYCTSLTILAGGAIGNVIDRLVYGYVVDFLDFHWWGAAHFPAFNIADIGISLGAILIVLDEILRTRRENSEVVN